MSYHEDKYREIITKAVCGKGRKFSKEKHSISPAHKPSSILGCWVINHLYRAKKISKDTVEVRGNYDINIWYSFNDNTKTEVVSERVSYCDKVPLKIKDRHCIGDDFETTAKVIQQPNCLECTIGKKGNKIIAEVEREFLVKVIGETKVYVRVSEKKQHEKDDWDYEVTDEELKDIDSQHQSYQE